jgi:hypothetical protein
MLPALFAVYWLSVLVWSLLAARLCEALSLRHPLLYDSLGRPALLASNGLRGDFALLRFLVGGRYRLLDDRSLVRLCGAMRVFLVVYVLVFLSLPSLALR